MNPFIKEQWVRALRSGEYEQGRGYLKANGKYCCLGVLCEVVGIPSTPVEDSDAESFDGYSTYLPPSVQSAAELADGNPYVTYNAFSHSLADLNDETELSFSAIADLIEAQL